VRGRLEVWLSSDLTHAEELKRTPLDVKVACPDCGSETWDRVEWRAEPDEPTYRIRGVVCRSCGHLDFAYPAGRLRRPEPPVDDDPSPLSDDPSAAEILKAASFPIYMPAEPRLSLCSLGATGWGSDSGRLEGVVLRAGDRERSLGVGSYTDRLPLTATDRARSHLLGELRSALPDVYDRDHDVATLKRHAALRPLHAAVESAPAVPVDIPVDGDPVEFVLVEHGGRWAANAPGIIVTGRNLTPGEVALRLLRPDDELASACGP
jgi:hypothetical protein